MKRKLKCYMAYTTFLYRLLGVVLIPCAFWILCGLLLGSWRTQQDSGNLYGFYFTSSFYIVYYELFTDYWVLGGCFSGAGRGLKYFRTSHSGAEVLRNVVVVDLIRRFLYCMVLPGMIFLFTGWKTPLVMGLATYCAIVGMLHGSRHFDGLQRTAGIALLAQFGAMLVNVLNVTLLDLAGESEGVMLAVLAAIYCGLALALGRLMVRRVTGRVQDSGSKIPRKSQTPPQTAEV